MDEENSEYTHKQKLNNSSKIILLHNIRNNDLKNVMKEKDAVFHEQQAIAVELDRRK